MAIAANSLSGLDLGNVIQDLQTIASQTTLEDLLITTMKTCAKYTGAQKGLLLLKENEQLQVKAIFTDSPDEVLVLQVIPLETSKHFPHTIVNKAYKSNSVVTLDFAGKQHDIAGDSYLFQYQPALICCAPINYQSDKFGVVYLECNPDAVGFEAENIEILQILLAQTAISLKHIQKYAQAEQYTNNTDYGRLFKYAPTGIAYAQIIVDKTGNPVNYKYLDVNSTFEKMLGRKKEDVIGKTVTEVFPEIVQSEIDWIAECGSVALTGETKTIEQHSALYDVWYKVTIYSPRQGYFATNFEDITERKQAEQMLREEYNFRTSIIKYAAEGLCVCHECEDHPFVEFTVWNNRMEEITGYTMEQINQAGWYQAMYPDPEVQNRAIERMSRMRVGDNLESEPWQITRADGEKRTINITTSILLSDDGNVHVLGLMDDVTTQKRVERALRESEQRFRAIFETAGIGVALSTVEGELLQVNPAYQTMVGFSAEELVGRSFFDLTHPNDISMQVEKQKDALSKRSPQPYQLEKRYIRKDGQVIWVRTSSSFIIDNKGNPQYGLGLVEDITKDKQSTEALTRYAKEMTALYETSLEINSEQDIPTLFQTIVERAANLLGSKMATLALVRPDNKTLEIVNVLNRPKERVGFIINPGQGISGHIIKTGQPLMISNYAEWDDRIADLPKEGVGKILGVPLKQGDRVTGVLNVFDEQVGEFSDNQIQLLSLFATYVTIVVEKAHLLEAARRRAAQFEALRQVSQDLMVLQDLETLLFQITERTLQLLGRTHGGVALYRANLDKLEWVVKIDTGLLLPTGVMLERNQGVAGKVWDTLQTVIVNDYQNWDGKLLDKPGHYAAVIGSPIQWGADFLGVIIVTDTPKNPFTYEDADLLTQFAVQAAVAIQNTRLYQQVQHHNLELERSNQELQEFAYIASHDLQEPLRKIQTFGQRLESRYGNQLDKRGLDYLERMQGAASRMQTLIEDLLTFSRITTKAQPYTPVNLNQIVKDVLLDLETHIEDVNGQVNVDKLPEIEADPTQMRQLFQNLVGNALKFHRPTVAPIICITSKKQSNGYYKISVADNGIGFDEKYTDRIFGMFQRLHSRSQYKGTGVGLAVCKKIVERHSGTITAKSKPENGAIFIITLPLKQNH